MSVPVSAVSEICRAFAQEADIIRAFVIRNSRRKRKGEKIEYDQNVKATMTCLENDVSSSGLALPMT